MPVESHYLKHNVSPVAAGSYILCHNGNLKWGCRIDFVNILVRTVSKIRHGGSSWGDLMAEESEEERLGAISPGEEPNM